MKSLRCTFVVLCAVVVLSTAGGTALAQCPSSPPDCPSPPNPGFVHNCYTTTIVMTHGTHIGSPCTATICYCFRHGCGVFNDFSLSRNWS